VRHCGLGAAALTNFLEHLENPVVVSRPVELLRPEPLASIADITALPEVPSSSCPAV
jgi:hypothetical protein